MFYFVYEHDNIIYRSWPSEEATDWTTFEATFKFKSDENSPPCDNCYAAFWIETNAYPIWDTDVTWHIRDLKLKRESSNVVLEDPITSFESELVEVRRMDYLSDVEAAGWDRTGLYVFCLYCFYKLYPFKLYPCTLKTPKTPKNT